MAVPQAPENATSRTWRSWIQNHYEIGFEKHYCPEYVDRIEAVVRGVENWRCRLEVLSRWLVCPVRRPNQTHMMEAGNRRHLGTASTLFRLSFTSIVTSGWFDGLFPLRLFCGKIDEVELFVVVIPSGEPAFRNTRWW